MTRKRRATAGRRRWWTPLFVAASLILHAAVLGPLALGPLGLDLTPFLDGPHPPWPGPIDVVLVRRPSLAGEPSRGRATPASGARFMTTPVTEIGSSENAAQIRTGPVEPADVQASSSPVLSSSDRNSVQGPIDGIADPWRVQPGAGSAAAAVPGPIRPNCRRTELLPPIEREICATRLAAAANTRLGQRRLTRSEASREGGFAEQAAANEAWAAYRRSGDDGQSYPGLLSMLKHY